MHEVEVKILEVSHDSLRSSLASLGAEKVFEGVVHTVLFETDEDVTLRLRKAGDRSFLTLKRKLPSEENVKVRDEIEFEVSSFDEAKRFLVNLGFVESSSSSKRRVSYRLGGARLEFDRFLPPRDFVPGFLEIESENPETVFRTAELLGFSRGQCKPWSGKDLFRHYS
ncbi:MAG: class IV adenylate cyclase [Candidatus Woesearchaeota archaeon]